MLPYWLPAISSSAIVAVLGFLLSIPYRQWIERRIEHGFDAKLEELKAGIRRDEETLRAELQRREGEIEAMRSGVLSNLAARHAELSKRQIQAIEAVWNHVVHLGQYKTLLKMAETVNLDATLIEAAKPTEDGRKTREFIELIWKASNVDAIHKSPPPPPDRERPFVPPLAWATFRLYRQVLFYPVMQFAAAREGASPQLMADPKDLIVGIRTAMPDLADMLDQHGSGAFPFVIELLETHLLMSLVSALRQLDAPDSAIEQAAQILKAVDAAVTERAKAQARELREV